MELDDLSPLTDEIMIGNRAIRNRFVRSATHEWLADPDGTPNQKIKLIYWRLAKNNVGLIISGYSFVSPCGRSSEGQQAIYSDKFIESYSDLAKSVKKAGGRLFIQIVHGGRQALSTDDCPLPVAPSAVPIGDSGIVPRALSGEEIEKIIDDFVAAAMRCQKSGTDGVQLHCAHGFLLNNFLSPYANIREDDWGGDTESRTKIVTEIISKARKTGVTIPISAKINCTDGVMGGIDLNEAIRISKILDSCGIDALEISGGTDESEVETTCQTDIISEEDEAYFKEESRMIKRSVSCPMILVGGLRSLSLMRRIVREGYADMVSLSRPLIREPNLITKFLLGESNRATCVSCNKCFDMTGIRCNYKQPNTAPTP